MDAPWIEQEPVLTSVGGYTVERTGGVYLVSSNNVHFEVAHQTMHSWMDRCAHINIHDTSFDGRVLSLNGHKIHTELARKICHVVGNLDRLAQYAEAVSPASSDSDSHL